VKNLPRPEIITEYIPSSSEIVLDIFDKFDEAFKVPSTKTKSIRQTQNLTTEEINYLKNTYSTYGKLSIRHRERKDAEIKFRAKEETLNELLKIFDKTPFVAKKSLDKGYLIVRMYDRQQIMDFLNLLELEEEYKKLSI